MSPNIFLLIYGQRSVSEGNALISNAYMVDKNVNRQRLTFFLPTTKTINVYFFNIFISANFQRFKIEW